VQHLYRADWLLVAACAAGLALLVLLVVQWWHHRQVRSVFARVRTLEARVQRLHQAKTRRDWRDDTTLTKYNWKKPEPF
jgi:heme exporter protein D